MLADADRSFMYELYSVHTVLYYRTGIHNRFPEGIRTRADVVSIQLTDQGKGKSQDKPGKVRSHTLGLICMLGKVA